MKILSLFLILAGLLTITACDGTQKPKRKTHLVEHDKVLQKAKEVEHLLQEATEKRLKQVDGLN